MPTQNQVDSFKTIADKVKQHYINETPFVLYREPGLDYCKARFQTSNNSHTVTSFSDSGFVFAPFLSSELKYCIPENDSTQLNFKIEAANDKFQSVIQSSESSISKNEYQDLVNKAVNSIKANQFQKVVLSRKETVKIENINFLIWFKQLVNTYNKAFVYCWFHPKTGLWLGATPEQFIKTDRNTLKTVALAATRLITSTNKTWPDKETEEQQLVTDFISNTLTRLGGNLKLEGPFTKQAGYLEHLCTNITTRFKKQIPLEQIVRELHPTPAVCGLPKNDAFNFIRAHETYDRLFYTGYLGELNIEKTVQRNRNSRNVEQNAYKSISKSSSLYVNLRCMLVKANHVDIFVGGGVTKDSDPEQEWLETVNKTQTMKSVL